MNVPQSFTVRLAKRAEDAKRQGWRNQYTPVAFLNLADNLQQLILSVGYTLNCSPALFTKRLEEYAWCVTKASAKQGVVSFQQPSHLGTDDDYEWFVHSLSRESLDLVFGSWGNFELFDTSPVGIRMRDSIHDFLWPQLNLEASRRHWKVVQMRECYEDEDSYQDAHLQLDGPD